MKSSRSTEKLPSRFKPTPLFIQTSINLINIEIGNNTPWHDELQKVSKAK